MCNFLSADLLQQEGVRTLLRVCQRLYLAFVQTIASPA